MILFLLGVIAVMFVFQCFLGFWQVKDFNKHYGQMRSEGKVAIGRSKGLIRTGVILLMNVDNNHYIHQVRKMQGVTVFARIKPFDSLNGNHLLKPDADTVKKMDRFTRKAFEDAQHVYRVVQAGGEVPKPKSPLEKLFSITKKKKGEVSNS
ncbi:transcriptional regulator [Salibacterium salarium]|uniref:Transcriptional regulator n=1 Tax=Salibacterium salarium TaxID=284579 RepID=A0A3R9P0C5_9BACI|nr:transcriptional regulator GutM [Salibacterium salarium]RSL30120.1 transcriptional regulator [Salibacterium salarium]